MIRNCIQVYLELMGCAVLAGCTAGPVEGVVPENARMVALSFGKPDLGMPVVLTRAGEAGAPSPELLPEGATLRIGAYFRSDPGEEQAAPVSFSTAAPTLEATIRWKRTVPCHPVGWTIMGNRLTVKRKKWSCGEVYTTFLLFLRQENG